MLNVKFFAKVSFKLFYEHCTSNHTKYHRQIATVSTCTTSIQYIGTNMNFVGEFYAKYKSCSASEALGETHSQLCQHCKTRGDLFSLPKPHHFNPGWVQKVSFISTQLWTHLKFRSEVCV